MKLKSQTYWLNLSSNGLEQKALRISSNEAVKKSLLFEHSEFQTFSAK